MERLQKVIAGSGYCSRRKAEELISSGKVRVNGCVVTELGVKVDGNDEIMIGNKIISREEKEYILLNKPRGVVTTTSDEKNRKTVLDLINTDKRLYPVGRLDYDTTGALLLTNDGELTNILIHPKNNVNKLYVAKVEGFFDKKSCLTLEKGVVIDGVRTSKCIVKLKKYDNKNNTSIVYITIHEGRNHQVKKMFDAVGFHVIKLKREMFAFLDVNGLKSGEYRFLSVKEVKQLYSLGK
jgi:23S rRNA pseudouridine2605 synthase